MSYKVYLCTYKDAEKTTIETRLFDEEFSDFAKAFVFASKFMVRHDFEHLEICRVDNDNEMVYYIDNKGKIEDYITSK